MSSIGSFDGEISKKKKNEKGKRKSQRLTGWQTVLMSRTHMHACDSHTTKLVLALHG